jgi:hypothetical protein
METIHENLKEDPEEDKVVNMEYSFLSVLKNLAVKKTSQIGIPNLCLLTFFICFYLEINQLCCICHLTR